MLNRCFHDDFSLKKRSFLFVFRRFSANEIRALQRCLEASLRVLTAEELKQFVLRLTLEELSQAFSVKGSGRADFEGFS